MCTRVLWSLLGTCIAASFLAASAGALPPAACNARVNNTPSKLVECITQADLMTHLQAFQAIANANPGADGHPSRDPGEPGYRASVDYVANAMRAAGYNVTIQQYTFPYAAFDGVPTLSEVSPTARTFALVSDWNAGQSNGDATNVPIVVAGHTVVPSPGGSTSGCDPSDFSGAAGKIALIQRGTCTFSQKIQNASDAGAVGVVIFNEGNTPARTPAFNGSLSSVPDIPVAFTSYAVGQSLYDEYVGGTPPVLDLSVHVIIDPARPDWNVIAESKGGDPSHVLVVDAHLDSIHGSGMLDNATGSAAILDIAQKMKNVVPTNKLRFIWFGGEELGELGSNYYVDNLSPTDLGNIFYDLDADVFGTPNYDIGILDPAAVDFFGRTVSTQFPANVYQPSLIARDRAVDFFDARGLNHIFFSPVGTDAEQFNLAGIPASGLLTGQDCCKTQQEVDLFGGTLGNYEGNLGSFDGGCVDLPFRWCDNIDNVDPGNFELMSKAFADMVARMAFYGSPQSPHLQSVVVKKQTPARGAGPAR